MWQCPENYYAKSEENLIAPVTPTLDAAHTSLNDNAPNKHKIGAVEKKHGARGWRENYATSSTDPLKFSFINPAINFGGQSKFTIVSMDILDVGYPTSNKGARHHKHAQ